MKIQELIKGLIDLIDRVDGDESNKIDPAQDKQEVMISPLQQDLELAKKTASVDSSFDDQEDDESSDAESDPDDLVSIKIIAGIPTGH